MGRVTRVQFEQLHIYRVHPGRLESAAERWWEHIGGLLRGEDPRVVDAWLADDSSAFALVVADRHKEPLDAVVERGRAVLGADLEAVEVHDLRGFRERHVFAGAQAQPDPSLPNPRASRWQQVEIGEDDRTLRIGYLRGVVHYLHHVGYTADRWNVEVTVFLGFDREYWERVQQGERIGYTLVGISEWTSLVLAEPIGDRYVLDGAVTDP